MRWVTVLLSFMALISPVRTATAQQISTIERNALISLYNFTNGASWTNNFGWVTQSYEECSWYGVTCDAGHVTELLLGDNGLVGYIPAAISNLNYLIYLDLEGNDLTGQIPVALASLVNLDYLYLAYNHLDGDIPPELATLVGLKDLYLDHNRLTGAIPSQLGSLTDLEFFSVASNKLVGSIPTSLMNLENLIVADPVTKFNALYTDDLDLKAFLDVNDELWDWTQTVVPEDISVGLVTSSSVVVSWVPILFTDYTGYYSVIVAEDTEIFADGFESGGTSMWSAASTKSRPVEFRAVDGTDVWNAAAPKARAVEYRTLDKTDNSILIDQLQPGTRYKFVVRTTTEPHIWNNQNTVISEDSAPVFATTN